jgi:hypothetical protein
VRSRVKCSDDLLKAWCREAHGGERWRRWLSAPFIEAGERKGGSDAGHVEQGEGGGSQSATGGGNGPWPAGAGDAASVQCSKGGQRKGAPVGEDCHVGWPGRWDPSDHLNEFKPKIQTNSKKFKTVKTWFIPKRTLPSKKI